MQFSGSQVQFKILGEILNTALLLLIIYKSGPTWNIHQTHIVW
jgi:hypothetical protein